VSFGVSVVTWCNNFDMWKQHVLSSIAGTHQVADCEVQAILVSPRAGAKNIGQAYNMGIAEAKHPIKVFLHQDVHIYDRLFMAKLDKVFKRPHVGAVGIVGSTVDTGAAFFHAPLDKQVGRYRGQWWPQNEQVKVVDGLLLATNQDFRFSEEYETVHMAVEDYCLQVREAGLQVWTIDSFVDHLSGGDMDDDYWLSAYKFRRKWEHMLPDNLPSLSHYARKGLDRQVVDSEIEWMVL
jgi:hypothetical protein